MKKRRRGRRSVEKTPAIAEFAAALIITAIARAIVKKK